MQISIDQLVQWHNYFLGIKEPSKEVNEIVKALEKRLHEILTTLKPTPTQES